MRYTSAVVLSTLAIGQAAASHNRHASFHERRQASDVKRDSGNVDWSKVAYDLSGVNWSTVKYNQGQATPAPSAAQPSAAAAAVQPSSQAAPAPAASSSPAAKAQSSSSTSGNVVTDVMQSFTSIAGKLGVLPGLNSNSNNGAMWIGSDSQWKATFQNQASDTAILVCWTKDGYTGMFPQATAPKITAGISPGQSVTVSFAGNVGSACAPIFPDTILQPDYKYIFQTWFEVTFPGSGGTGGFDITRIPNMNGRSIVAKGSMCQSDLNTCVFKCTGGVDHCTTGYDLFGCGSGTGGGGGYDAAMGGTGGGCSMSQSAENINVSLY